MGPQALLFKEEGKRTHLGTAVKIYKNALKEGLYSFLAECFRSHRNSQVRLSALQDDRATRASLVEKFSFAVEMAPGNLHKGEEGGGRMKGGTRGGGREKTKANSEQRRQAVRGRKFCLERNIKKKMD